MKLIDLLKKHSDIRFQLLMFTFDGAFGETDLHFIFHLEEELSYDFVGHDGVANHELNFDPIFDIWADFCVEEEDLYYLDEENAVVCALRNNEQVAILRSEGTNRLYRAYISAGSNTVILSKPKAA